MRRLLLLTATLLVLLPTAGASAYSRMESTFQDDPRLVYGTPKVRNATLDEVKALGVDRIRVSVFWNLLAPQPTSGTKPEGFDGSDPNAYAASAWARYDDLIDAIHARGMKVNLNPTAPGPLWAMSGAFDARIADRTNPSPEEFGAFMVALGRRYAGGFVPSGATAPRPRIDYWSIWNEPNQGGWLSPQWTAVGTSGVEQSPQQYRRLVDASWAALQATGHTPQSDTILVGETAPKGTHAAKDRRTRASAMDAMRFFRRLYCLNDRMGFLTGADAKAVECPETPNAAEFVAAHPALFQMTGYAHHPYELTLAPDRRPTYPDDWVTTANLGTLTDQLERAMARYKVNRKAIPLYLTEFGYQSFAPDPLGVSLAKQAAYINQAEYIAYKNRYVKTLAQFLLYDDAPTAGDSNENTRWNSSFQTGLRFGEGSRREGRAKPSYDAYRLPIYLPRRNADSKGRLPLWGRVRPGAGSGARTVEVQVRGAKGSYRRLARYRTSKYGFVNRTIRVRRTGAVRLAWKSGTKTYYSRGVSFRARR